MNARIVLVSYPNDGRTLKRLITALLKSGAAKCIQRFNYVKSYYMREGKMKQEEEKILLIKTTEDKLAKLNEILTNFPWLKQSIHNPKIELLIQSWSTLELQEGN